MVAFVMVLIQQLFPLPEYPVIAPLSYALVAAVILLVPDIGIVIMEIKAVRKQLIWMNAAAAVLYAVLFVIQLVTVPALLSEAVHSETSNAGDFGTYDAAVQKEMDALPLIREIGDNENIVFYHYDYAPMLENWNVQIETKWKNAV